MQNFHKLRGIVMEDFIIIFVTQSFLTHMSTTRNFQKSRGDREGGFSELFWQLSHFLIPLFWTLDFLESKQHKGRIFRIFQSYRSDISKNLYSRFWNSLPLNIKSIVNSNSFKKAVKSFLYLNNNF